MMQQRNQSQENRRRLAVQPFMWGFFITGSLLVLATWLLSRVAGFDLDAPVGLLGAGIALGALYLLAKPHEKDSAERAE